MKLWSQSFCIVFFGICYYWFSVEWHYEFSSRCYVISSGIHLCIPLHLSDVFPSVAFGTVPRFLCLVMAMSHSTLRTTVFYAFLLRDISGAMSLAMCLQVVFQAPQNPHHFRTIRQYVWPQTWPLRLIGQQDLICEYNLARVLFQRMIMIILNPNWSPYWTGTEAACSGKLVSDIFRAVDRGHNPRNGPKVPVILSVYSSIIQRLKITRSKAKCMLAPNVNERK